jgi:membrane protein required for colicin V production
LNGLDIIIIVCIVAGVIKGLFDGLIKQAIALAGLALAILFSGTCAQWLQFLLSGLKMMPEQLLYAICYVTAFVVILALMAIVGRLLHNVWEMTPFGCLNRLAGGLVGFVIMVIALSLLFNLMVVFSKQIPIIKEEIRKESVWFEKIKSIVPTLYPYLKLSPIIHNS